MAHVIEYADGWLYALVDQSAPSLHKAPLTPTSEQVSKSPPVFKVAATWPAMGQLMNTMPGAVLTPAAQTWATDVQLAARLDAWAGVPHYQPPEGLTPYPWQTQAQVAFPKTLDLLLNDDPGTGKTISAVLALAEAYQVDAITGPTLVVCPAGVVSSWLSVLADWAPHLEAARYMGPKRARLWEDGPEGPRPVPRVLVTSYETAGRDLAKLEAKWWGALVLDEHHLIKNPDSARSKAARKLADKADGVIALSGTPITHHPGDLWPPLYCLEPKAYPSRTRYRDRYLDTVPAEYGEEVVGFIPHRRGEFDLGLLGVQRRVAKLDALPWLPPKVYQVREVALPPEARKLYRSMEDELVAAIPDSDEPLNAFSVLAQLQFLQALAAAPCDVEVTTTLDDEGQEVKHYHAILKPESWKVTELMAVLEERPLDQVVVFSAHRQLVELAGLALDAANIGHRYVVGGQSSGERDRALEDFQAGRARVILVVTGAGGVGITLTAANCAVFLSRPWSLVEALQAEDRVHRIGSEVHDSIDIVDIVATGTVDGAIRTRLVDKADQLGDVLHDSRVVRDVLGGKR